MCGCLTHPPSGTQPATQACALTGNRTHDPLVHRLALNPLSHASQGSIHFLNLVISPLSPLLLSSFIVAQLLYTFLTSFLSPVSSGSHSSDKHAPFKHTNGLPSKIFQWLVIPYGKIHWDTWTSPLVR